MPRAARPRFAISTRLTLWYGLTLLVLLSVFAAFSYGRFRAGLRADFDRHLSHERHQLLPFVRLDGAAPAFAALDELRSVAYQTDGVYGTYVRLLAPDGAVRYRSPNFARHAALAPLVPAGAPREATATRLWEGRPARTLTTPLVREGRLRGWLEVTGFEWTMRQELVRLGETLAAGIALCLLLALGVGFVLARRALRPVAALTDAARAIGPRDLAARLPADFGPRDELSDLAETFNAMLARLEASFQRERRFTAHAAHELLTPLATLRSEVEVALRRDRDAEAYRAALRRVLLDVDALAAMARGLLHLAQLERRPELPRPPTDLAAVAAARAERHAPRLAERGLALRLDAPAPVVVGADPAQLAEVVDNLLDNARKYTPPGGTVTLAVTAERATGHSATDTGATAGGAPGGEAVLAVTDTGAGFAAADGERLFERFFRSDDPAVQAEAGSGLGLALVAALAEAYGGRAAAASPGPGRGSRFEVRFPLAMPAMEPTPPPA